MTEDPNRDVQKAAEIYERSKISVELVVTELNNLAPGRFSACLVNQIAYMPYQGMSEPYQFILPEILHLEDSTKPTKTVDAEEFKRPEMQGLWKKHFYMPNYLGVNVRNFWKLDSCKSQKLSQAFQPFVNIYSENPSEEAARKVAAEMARKFVETPVQEGQTGKRKLTGEYIIFKQYRGMKYYLCLGGHQTDEFILKNVCLAYKDFPFLADGQL